MIKNKKEMIFDFLKKEAAQGSREVDTQMISKNLRMQRSNVSSLLNQLVEDGHVRKTKTRPVYYSIIGTENVRDCFTDMIGSNGSLNNVMQLAKAAILYPEKSLDILIVGSSGTGKSYLAKLIFDFAQQMNKLAPTAEFRKLNCKHYMNDPEELAMILFGSPKEKQQNLLDRSQGSMLFIDNVHLLDGESMSRLNDYLESGNYTYLDGTKSATKNVLLVLSIDTDANHELLTALKAKISVKIELPALVDRPLTERFELINHFFMEEAIITKHDIVIDPEVMRALLLIETNFNIKYLYGSIKVAVANAYLRCYDSSPQMIQVNIHDFDKNFGEALLRSRKEKRDIEAIIPMSFDYKYSKAGYQTETDVRWSDFYDYLNQKVNVLQHENLSKAEMDEILDSEINHLINSFKQELGESKLNLQQLSKVVDAKIIDLVTEFVDECEERLQMSFANSVVYGLCLHIQAIYKNKREGRSLKTEKIQEIINDHELEYQEAVRLADKIEAVLDKKLTIDETVMLAMFLINEDPTTKNTFPQILIAMHGDSGASSLATVINSLVEMGNTYAYDMPLQKESGAAYEELKNLILEIDQGNGVIVIYDMGSIGALLEKIMTEIAVEIRMIELPITAVGLEASRKAAMEVDIDTVYHDLLIDVQKDNQNYRQNQQALITICHTGEGGAEEIKEYLQKNYRDDIKIYPLAMSDRKRLATEVQTIKKYYTIKAFIGTYDPKLFGISFIPVSKIFGKSRQELDNLILMNLEEKEIDYNQMIDYITSELALDPVKLKKALPEVLIDLDISFGLTIDQRVGLFLHISALVHHLVEHLPLNQDQPKLEWNEAKEALNRIRKIVKPLEQVFEVIIPDKEIIKIYEIIESGVNHE